MSIWIKKYLHQVLSYSPEQIRGAVEILPEDEYGRVLQSMYLICNSLISCYHGYAKSRSFERLISASISMGKLLILLGKS